MVTGFWIYLNGAMSFRLYMRNYCKYFASIHKRVALTYTAEPTSGYVYFVKAFELNG